MADNLKKRKSRCKGKQSATDQKNDHPEKGKPKAAYHPAQSNKSKHKYFQQNFTSRDPRIMSIMRLREVETKLPTEVLFILIDRNEGFLTLISQKNLGQERLHLILSVLSKACRTNEKDRLGELLRIIYSYQDFTVTGLQLYLAEIQNLITEPEKTICLERFLTLLEAFHDFEPDKSFTTLAIMLPQLKDICSLEDKVPKDILKRVEDLEMKKCIYREKYSVSFLGNKEKSSRSEDFRKIPLLPNSEDLSDKPPRLRKNIVIGQYEDVEDYLDIHFRLLREDFIRPIREGIASYTEYLLSKTKHIRIQDVCVYKDVHVSSPELTNDEIQHVVTFDPQPFKHTDWETNKRLLFGSLLCFSHDNFETKMYATVTKRDAKDVKKGTFSVRIEDAGNVTLAEIPKLMFVALEPKAYFESYRYNLKALQKMNDSNFPFAEFIVRLSRDVGPPMYLKPKEEVKREYCLQPLLVASKNTEDACCTQPTRINYFRDWPKKSTPVAGTPKCEILNDQAWPSSSELGLDHSQFDALKMALTKELAIIQGPPGTGKTYVGLKVIQALLHNSKKWEVPGEVGHILVICYTNHALDQFLEGVLRYTDSVVRFGGRCKNENLESYNIKALRRKGHYHSHCYEELSTLKHEMTKFKSTLAQCQTKIFDEHELKMCISKDHFYSLSFHRPCFMPMVKSMMTYWLGVDTPGFMEDYQRFKDDNWLEKEASGKGEHLPSVANNIDKEEESTHQEEFSGIQMQLPVGATVRAARNSRALQEKKKKKDSKKTTGISSIQNLREFKAMSRNELGHLTNVWDMSTTERRRLYKTWIESFKDHIHNQLKELSKDYQLMLEEKKCRENLDIAKNRRVIGMTTTGAAKFQKVMQELKPQIVIVEEAAEVLEAHIVTALSGGTQHLILIGDHQQLRPNPTVYELAKRYKLDVSLFERLVNNGLPFCRLSIQHRMKPCIAKLLVPHVYEYLENHVSVSEYEDIRGVTKSMFFIDHTEKEVAQFDSTSHVNRYEAEYLVELCLYLMKQGYRQNQITVLTTYLGQFRLLSNLMNDPCKDVRVTVVDNFQGEENDIILLSLVRSNEEGKAGFLKIENRVCVALSRAKKGFYCIGNFALLQKESQLWQKICTELILMEAVGQGLCLICQNHGNTTVVKFPRDFDKFSDGGCSQPCEFHLPCGHSCTLLCHPYDKDHRKFKCKKVCDKIVCTLEHKCPNLCHFPCSSCRGEELVGQNVRCNKKCQCSCDPCQMMVTKVFEPCGHKIEVACNDDKCPAICNKVICSLNHTCPKQCHQPCDPCKILVKKVKLCGHEIYLPCHKNPNEEPCLLPCMMTFECGHICQNKCCDLCGPCEVIVRKVIEQCGHEINLQCHKDANIETCLETCNKTMECGHICKNKCCEPCGLCEAIVPKIIDQCGHIINLQCCKDPNSETCLEKCNKTLKCGHKCCSQCYKLCEPCQVVVPKVFESCGHEVQLPCCVDPKTESCSEPCKKVLECGHRCTNQCYDACSPCKVIVPKVFEPCSHEVQLPCSADPRSEICLKPCTKSLACGHVCPKHCGHPCQTICTFLVTVQACCGHSVQVQCHMREDKETIQNMCYEKCERERPCKHPCPVRCGLPCPTECKKIISQPSPCGHEVKIQCNLKESEFDLLASCRHPCASKLECDHCCSGTCFECNQGRMHKVCEKICNKLLVCGHVCKHPCYINCPPCSLYCENWCPHEKCYHQCSYPCFSCRKPCSWKCQHYRCTLTCGEPCNRPPCEKPCEKLLKCRHTCIGLCGEACPRLCRTCDRRKVTELYFGNEKEPSARFIQLQDCGHFFEVKGLTDWIMGQKKISTKLPSCPKCRVPIKYNQHFSAYIKARISEIQEIKMRKLEQLNQVSNKFFLIDSILQREYAQVLKICTNNPIVMTQILEGWHVPTFKSTYIIVWIINALNETNCPRTFCFDFLVEMENMIYFAREIKKVEKLFFEQREKLDDVYSQYLCSSLENIIEVMANNFSFFSNQLLQDVWWELKRLVIFCNMAINAQQFCKSEDSQAQKLVENAMGILIQWHPFREDQEKIVVDIVGKLQNMKGMRITSEPCMEQQNIVRSVSVKQGTWQRYKNGFV